MITYPTIKRHTKKNRSLTATILSTGLLILLSLSTPQAFSKVKAGKKTHITAVKTNKDQTVKTIKSAKVDNKAKSVNKTQSENSPAIQTTSNHAKQKTKSLHSANVSNKHEIKKPRHSSIILAKKFKEEPTSAPLNLINDSFGFNEHIHSLITPSINEMALNHPQLGGNKINGPITSVHGSIDQSLAESAIHSGLTNELVEQLTSIFAWDIDFANNLDQGDKYTLIYEQGADQTEAQIVAAEFTNRGRILTALRYTTPDGTINYFSPEGKPMRKAFLSAPLDYLKISSGFSTHRKHPILNRIRAHKGVDYAARTGTPVKSAAMAK